MGIISYEVITSSAVITSYPKVITSSAFVLDVHAYSMIEKKGKYDDPLYVQFLKKDDIYSNLAV